MNHGQKKSVFHGVLLKNNLIRSYKARSVWPTLLLDLPMDATHKEKLKEHWKKLHSDFQILAHDECNGLMKSDSKIEI